MAGLGAKERILAETTLVCLLQAAQGHVTTVELRNESSAEGKIENVDGYMNIVMTNVKLTKQNGQVLNLPQMFIHGRHIRFVQIPDEIDMRAALKKQADKYKRFDVAPGSKKMPRSKQR